MTLPEKIIVDTNVPINANLANTPKKFPLTCLIVF